MIYTTAMMKMTMHTTVMIPYMPAPANKLQSSSNKPWMILPIRAIMKATIAMTTSKKIKKFSIMIKCLYFSALINFSILYYV